MRSSISRQNRTSIAASTIRLTSFTQTSSAPACSWNVRDWIHVDDHCTAIVAALFEGKPGQVYNFGGNSEMVNLDLVRMILDQLGKPHSLISFVPDRLGHDRRYAIDSSFAQRELDWKPLRSFKEGLDETIQWYIENPSWWQPLLERTGRY